MIKQSVCAIVRKEGKYLIVQRVKRLGSKNRLVDMDIPEWDLVKGGIESHETAEAAVLRELFEETGSKDYKIVRTFKKKLSYANPPIIARETGYDGRETSVYIVDFYGDPSKLISSDGENDRFEFVTPDEVIKRLKYPETRNYFKAYILEKP